MAKQQRPKSRMHLRKELMRLQDRLATVDLLTADRSDPDLLFILLKRLEAIRIRMDSSKNHQRAHVHIDYGKQYHAASYAIDTGKRIAGKLDRKYDRTVQEWIADYRPKL